MSLFWSDLDALLGINFKAVEFLFTCLAGRSLKQLLETNGLTRWFYCEIYLRNWEAGERGIACHRIG